MNKAQIQYEKCKRVSEGNTKCLGILLKLIDRDREDIIDRIAQVNKAKYRAITPEGIVTLYNSYNEDLDKFIEKYDKTMDSANYIRKNFYNNYEKGMKEFCDG